MDLPEQLMGGGSSEIKGAVVIAASIVAFLLYRFPNIRELALNTLRKGSGGEASRPSPSLPDAGDLVIAPDHSFGEVVSRRIASIKDCCPGIGDSELIEVLEHGFDDAQAMRWYISEVLRPEDEE